MKKAIVPLLSLLCIGSLGTNFYLFQKYSSKKTILTLKDGEQITLKDYRDRLEFLHGRETLRKLAMTRIVTTAAKKANVFPPERAVEARIKDLERTTPEAIPAQRREELKQELTLEMALEGLSMRDVTLTEADAQKFFTQHPELFQLPRQSKVTLVVAIDEVRAGTAERMLHEKNVNEATLAMEPGMKVAGLNGFSPNLDALPEAERERLRTTALSLAPGAVVRLNLSGTRFILRGETQEAAQLPSFDAVREKALRLARLSRARPRPKVMAALYREAGVQFEMDYRDWFRDLQEQSVQAASTK
jgi:hypothetical protein